jgi:hypothetical protein
MQKAEEPFDWGEARRITDAFSRSVDQPGLAIAECDRQLDVGQERLGLGGWLVVIAFVACFAVGLLQVFVWFLQILAWAVA